MTSTSGKSTATRTIRIDADIAPRAALLAAAAAKMGASDAAIEEVLTTHREAGARLTDEELVNQMVETTQRTARGADAGAGATDLTPLIATAVENATPEDFSRDTLPMAPPKPVVKTPARPRKNSKRG